MKIGMIIASQLAVIISISVAGFLAYKNIDGWGWFLFIALVSGVSIESKSKKRSDCE